MVQLLRKALLGRLVEYEETSMKKSIHPDYVKCVITCACGNVVETRSTLPEIKIEICSTCHPFFTGRQKFIDRAGRIEKFAKKYGKFQEKSKTE